MGTLAGLLGVEWTTERLQALAIVLLIGYVLVAFAGAGYLGFLASRTALRFAKFREWYSGLHARRAVKGLEQAQRNSRVVSRPPVPRATAAPTELAPLPVEPPPLPTLRSDGVAPAKGADAALSSKTRDAPPLDWSDSRLLTTRFRPDESDDDE